MHDDSKQKGDAESSVACKLAFQLFFCDNCGASSLHWLRLVWAGCLAGIANQLTFAVLFLVSVCPFLALALAGVGWMPCRDCAGLELVAMDGCVDPGVANFCRMFKLLCALELRSYFFRQRLTAACRWHGDHRLPAPGEAGNANTEASGSALPLGSW